MAKYITPAVTPLNEDGTIDEQGAGKLYEHLIHGGVDGILLLGSIGEFFAFSMEQKKQSPCPGNGGNRRYGIPACDRAL